MDFWNGIVLILLILLFISIIWGVVRYNKLIDFFIINVPIVYTNSDKKLELITQYTKYSCDYEYKLYYIENGSIVNNCLYFIQFLLNTDNGTKSVEYNDVFILLEYYISNYLSTTMAITNSSLYEKKHYILKLLAMYILTKRSKNLSCEKNAAEIILKIIAIEKYSININDTSLEYDYDMVCVICWYIIAYKLLNVYLDADKHKTFNKYLKYITSLYKNESFITDPILFRDSNVIEDTKFIRFDGGLVDYDIYFKALEAIGYLEKLLKFKINKNWLLNAETINKTLMPLRSMKRDIVDNNMDMQTEFTNLGILYNNFKISGNKFGNIAEKIQTNIIPSIRYISIATDKKYFFSCTDNDNYMIRVLKNTHKDKVFGLVFEEPVNRIINKSYAFKLDDILVVYQNIEYVDNYKINEYVFILPNKIQICRSFYDIINIPMMYTIDEELKEVVETHANVPDIVVNKPTIIPPPEITGLLEANFTLEIDYETGSYTISESIDNNILMDGSSFIINNNEYKILRQEFDKKTNYPSLDVYSLLPYTNYVIRINNENKLVCPSYDMCIMKHININNIYSIFDNTLNQWKVVS